MRYSEHYVEGTVQQVDSVIAVGVGVCYSEHYVEVTAQQVERGIACWMEFVTVNIMWKLLHSRWTVVLQFGWRVLQ